MLALCYYSYVINVNLDSSNANTVSFKYIQYIKKLKQHNICYKQMQCIRDRQLRLYKVNS